MNHSSTSDVSFVSGMVESPCYMLGALRQLAAELCSFAQLQLHGMLHGTISNML